MIFGDSPRPELPGLMWSSEIREPRIDALMELARMIMGEGRKNGEDVKEALRLEMERIERQRGPAGRTKAEARRELAAIDATHRDLTEPAQLSEGDLRRFVDKARLLVEQEDLESLRRLLDEFEDSFWSE